MIVLKFSIITLNGDDVLTVLAKDSVCVCEEDINLYKNM